MPRLSALKPASENAIQAAYFRWAALSEGKYPELALLHSIPNGAYKSPAARYLYKVTGLKSGVPDVFLPAARCGYHGLYIEFKSATGRVSDQQEYFARKLGDAGYLVVICRDAETAVQLTTQYLNGSYVAVNESEPRKRRKVGNKS